MSDGFYVYLPSNNNYMHTNRSWSYITKLAREISLDEGWEVALKEIHYPHSWTTVKEGECAFEIKNSREEEWRSIEIPSGHYSRKSLVAEMVKLVNNPDIPIRYVESSGKVEIGPLMNNYVRLTQPFVEILGYRAYEAIYTGHLTFRSDRPIDTERGIDSLYVYSDIVQTKLVGDSSVPLLSVVPVRGVYGEMQFKEYANPIYTDLSKNVFSTVEINLYGSSGEPIPFEFGKVTVLLHFRKKQ